ncbi:hypothetical protein BD410DRAFT_782176 [Rickenella mellea]|uniref:LYR motif-containing protein Cup1-like N-terminal domain-containing protein n=1 Tax=Rickenella mellea TaxID=50990 RepID=A0A4Y7QLA6_9AGAM|nr:hypothetical protein BD410DRAFT_782176 [Rickenella mellea]
MTARQDLKRLRAANEGDIKAVRNVLDVAYGRKGKLKWELLEPFLDDPSTAKLPKIIPAVESSRPPTYPSALSALLTSAQSRTSKPLKPDNLTTPTSLPARHDPDSEEARLLGPLSRRRHVNLLWRYFTVQTRKILPPLQVAVSELSKNGERYTEFTSNCDLPRLDVRGGAMQETGVFEHLHDIAGSVPIPRPLTRRQRRMSVNGDFHAEVKIPQPDRQIKPLPSRFLRRRHQEVLAKLPLLTYAVYDNDDGHGAVQRKPKFQVDLSSRAYDESLRHSSRRYPEVDEANMVWLHRAENFDECKGVGRVTGKIKSDLQ